MLPLKFYQLHFQVRKNISTSKRFQKHLGSGQQTPAPGKRGLHLLSCSEGWAPGSRDSTPAAQPTCALPDQGPVPNSLSNEKTHSSPLGSGPGSPNTNAPQEPACFTQAPCPIRSNLSVRTQQGLWGLGAPSGLYLLSLHCHPVLLPQPVPP